MVDPAVAGPIVRAQPYDLTYRDLFVDHLGLPGAERENRRRLLQEFQERYLAFAQSEAFQGTGVSLNKLTFREHMVYQRYGSPCKVCGEPIEKIKLGGRTASFCPVCQK